MQPRTLLGIGATAVAAALVLLAVATARMRLPEGIVRVRGVLSAETSIVVSQVAGHVLSVAVREGDEVEAGASLATLSSDRVVAEVEGAAAELDAARSALAQAELDAGVEAAELERIRTTQSAAQTRLDEARARFSDTELRTPGRGRVTSLRLRVGDEIARETRVAEIVDLDALRLDAEIAPEQRDRLAPGQAARVRGGEVDGPAVEAVVDSVEDVGSTRDPADAAASALARLRLVANPDRKLIPGTRADALVRWRDDVPFPSSAAR